MIASFLLIAAAAFTGDLWLSSQQTYREILAHPFLTGLTDGTLPRESFQYYLQQDTLYLEGFGKSLRALSAKAPNAEWRTILARHGEDALNAEKELHSTILKSYGVAPHTRIAQDPVNTAYIRHFQKAVEKGTFSDGLAAMLPCYWIYLEVGRDLVRRGSKDEAYQKWINTYADDSYAKSVNEVLTMMDALELEAPAKARAQKLFQQSARFEYEFWDMAWRHGQPGGDKKRRRVFWPLGRQ